MKNEKLLKKNGMIKTASRWLCSSIMLNTKKTKDSIVIVKLTSLPRCYMKSLAGIVIQKTRRRSTTESFSRANWRNAQKWWASQVNSPALTSRKAKPEVPAKDSAYLAERKTKLPVRKIRRRKWASSKLSSLYLTETLSRKEKFSWWKSLERSANCLDRFTKRSLKNLSPCHKTSSAMNLLMFQLLKLWQSNKGREPTVATQKDSLPSCWLLWSVVVVKLSQASRRKLQIRAGQRSLSNSMNKMAQYSLLKEEKSSKTW